MNSSHRRQSIWHLGHRLTGFNVAVIQAKGNQFLEAGIDLLMHGCVLGSDIGQFLKQTGATIIVIALCVLQPLAILRCASLGRAGLRVHGAGALHALARGGACDFPFAVAGGLLFLVLGLLRTGWRGRLRGTVPLGRGVVVHPPHVVVQVPSSWESESWNRPFTSFPQAKVWIVSVTM